MSLIAYVTVYDAQDLDAFNGIGFWIAACLRRQSYEVDFVGPLANHHRYVIGTKFRIYQKLLKQRYNRDRDPLRVRAWGREIADHLERRPADLVLSGVSPGSQPVAYLECKQPIVIWTDATFAAASEQNRANLVRLSRETRRTARANEAAALERCALAIYTSEWAAQSAKDVYGLDDSKVHVIPYGPSLEIDHDEDDVAQFVAARPDDMCRLLLVGTKWDGKGADTAVAAAVELNRRGLRTELDVVGCVPPPGTSLPDFVRLHGFLRKGVADEVLALRKLYQDAHFLILPTRAEACPGVICEANAFGVPALVTDVGGGSSALKDDRNGWLLPYDADGADYADLVLAAIDDRTRYAELAGSSFAEFRARLNWTAIGDRFSTLVEPLLPRRVAGPDEPRPTAGSYASG